MLKTLALLPFLVVTLPARAGEDGAARRLDFLVGAWKQDNRFLGAEFGSGAGGTGTMTCHWTLGDAWLVAESKLETPGRGPYEVLNLVAADAHSGKYRAYSFNSLGVTLEYSGEWQDEATLVFVATDAPAGRRARVVYSKRADGTVLFKAERALGDGPFEAYFESTLSR